MRLPRDVSGEVLCKRLTRLDYEYVRQKGSHRTMRTERDGRFNARVPMHNPIKPGMLSALLKDIARHHQLAPDELLDLLDL
jgi:predicted RNA binding protein YcfA (HicA-like mRNA interferase family)